MLDDGRQRRQQQIEDPLLRRLPRLLAHFGDPLLPHHVDRQLDEVAHHRLDVAADVADLGELRGFDLDERRLRQAREPPGDLGLADAGRADHQDVLRRDVLGHLRRQLLPPRAVAQRDRDRALGLVLSDDVLVELGDDLARGQRVGGGVVRFGKVNRHDTLTGSSIVIVLVRVDADAAGDRHRLLRRSRARVERGVPGQRLRRGQRVRAARSNRDDPVVGLDQIAGAGQQERQPRVHDDQHRLEPAQHAVGAPVLGELDGRALEIAAVLLELRFESREQRERVGGRAGKSGENAVVVQPADLLRASA